MSQFPPPPPPGGGFPPPPPPGGGFPPPPAHGGHAPAPGNPGGISPSMLQGMFASELKDNPMSSRGKLLFLIGLLVFAFCSFMQNWSRNSAQAAEAEATALAADNWRGPVNPRGGAGGRGRGGEVDLPKGPPNPEDGQFKDAWVETKGDAKEDAPPDTEVKVPDSEKEWYKKEEKKVKKFEHELRMKYSKRYAKELYEYHKDRWDDIPELMVSAAEKARDAQKLRHKAQMGTLGYFARWAGLACMILGLAMLSMFGRPNEQAAALLALGVGIVWPLLMMSGAVGRMG